MGSGIKAGAFVWAAWLLAGLGGLAACPAARGEAAASLRSDVRYASPGELTQLKNARR